MIKGSGTDLIDFLNRMSTNDLRKFPTEEYRKTILTTDKGRIIDLIYVFNFKDKKFLLTSDEFQEKVKTHLEKFIIMDDVSLELSSEKYFHIVITGDELQSTAEKFSDITPEVGKAIITESGVIVFSDDFRFPSLNILCSEKDLSEIKNKLIEIPEQTFEEYEYMRINACVPERENELNENINPLECGLENYISFKKGCYIGQEVIARLDSQGKRPKQMVKVISGKKLHPGDKIYSDEKESGFISSSVSYNGENVSLGFIRSVDLDFGTLNKYTVKTFNDEILKIDITKTN